MAEPRLFCCALCGRWGYRQFRDAFTSDGIRGDLNGTRVCTNDRACKRRAARVEEEK